MHAALKSCLAVAKVSRASPNITSIGAYFRSASESCLERAGYPARARKEFAVYRKIYGNSGDQGFEIVASGRGRAGALIASIINVTALVESISTIQIIELLQLVITPR